MSTTDNARDSRRLPSDGRSKIWLCGGGLAICLCMILGLLSFIVVRGLGVFWPRPIDLVFSSDRTLALGQEIKQTDDEWYYRVGNLDLTGNQYLAISKAGADLGPTSENALVRSRPKSVVLVERREWGRLFGVPTALTERLELSPEGKRRLQLVRELRNWIDVEAKPSEQRKLADEANALENRIRSEALTKRMQVGAAESEAELWFAVVEKQDESTDGNAQNWQRVSSKEDPQVSLGSLVQVERRWTSIEAMRRELPLKMFEVERLTAEAESTRERLARLDRSLTQSLDASLRTPNDVSLESIAGEVGNKLALEYELKSAQELVALLAENMPMLKDFAALQEVRIRRLVEDLNANARSDSKRQSEAVRELSASIRRNLEEQRVLQMRLEDARDSLERYSLQCHVVSNAEPIESSEANGNLVLVEQFGAGHKIFRSTDSPGQSTGVVIEFADGQTYALPLHSEPLANVVRVLPVNEQSLMAYLRTYLARWFEFLFSYPREANTAGGMFPAIWGTIVLTLLMTIAVVPLGVIAALYLNEYTSGGPLVSVIRISIHNLAGVPSIVYGVFGVAFFCYTVGAFIDGGPINADIEPFSDLVWYGLLGAVSITGTISFLATLYFARFPDASRLWLPRVALFLWLVCFVGVLFLVAKSPFFGGFFSEELPNPTFGKGGILWAALTLALLTLPIVIVCTEEALVRVPNSLRVGSFACGASKWQTIRSVVFPQAVPGIITGALLAMARGTGQVAPLMLVGALPTVADLPLDQQFPFLHGSRSFMHLGYQIYSLGLKSDDAQATEPFVFAAILLLLLVVCALHFAASTLRARQSKKYLEV